MTHEKKIEYMGMAAGLCKFGLQTKDMDLLVSLYEGIIEKGGEFSMRDAAEVRAQVEERGHNRLVEEKRKEFEAEQKAKS